MNGARCLLLASLVAASCAVFTLQVADGAASGASAFHCFPDPSAPVGGVLMSTAPVVRRGPDIEVVATVETVPPQWGGIRELAFFLQLADGSRYAMTLEDSPDGLTESARHWILRTRVKSLTSFTVSYDETPRAHYLETNGACTLTRRNVVAAISESPQIDNEGPPEHPKERVPLEIPISVATIARVQQAVPSLPTLVQNGDVRSQITFTRSAITPISAADARSFFGTTRHFDISVDTVDGSARMVHYRYALAYMEALGSNIGYQRFRWRDGDPVTSEATIASRDGGTGSEAELDLDVGADCSVRIIVLRYRDSMLRIRSAADKLTCTRRPAM